MAGQQGSIFVDVLGVVYKPTKYGHAQKFKASIKAIQFLGHFTRNFLLKTKKPGDTK